MSGEAGSSGLNGTLNGRVNGAGTGVGNRALSGSAASVAAPAAAEPPAQPVFAASLPVGRIEGRLALAQTVRLALQCAAREAWPTLILSDANFQHWPLGERAVVDALQTWARRGRHMLVMAREYDTLERLHPRFVTWRRTWAHRLDCRQCRQADPLELPSVLWSPHWFMLQLDRDHAVAIAGTDEERITRCGCGWTSGGCAAPRAFRPACWACKALQ